MEILDVDTAAILLLEDDGRSLVPRAAKGLEEEVQRRVRIPVGKGFAGRVAGTRQAVRISDLEHAEIVNPLLREKGLRSLLGVPLIVEGNVLGVLHVGLVRGAQFTDDDVDLLWSAGDRAALAIHGRLSERERGLADALQQSLIPKLPEVLGVGLEGRYLPAAEAKLGGDWYDAFPLPGGRLGMAIGDVSGRGFYAAALMGQLRSGLRAYAMDRGSPSEVVGAAEPAASPARARAQRHAPVPPPRSTGGKPPAGERRPPTPARAGRRRSAARTSRCPGPCRSARCATPITRTSRRGSSRARPSSSTPTAWSSGPASRWTRDSSSCAPTVCRTDCEPEAMCDAILRTMLPDGATRDDAALLVGRALPLSDPLELSLPADVDTIPSLRRVLGRWLREAEASSTEIEEITLACSEACANAIEHAYAPGPAALEVTASVSTRGRDRHQRPRLRKLAACARRPPGPGDGPDEGADGHGGRGLWR